MSIVSFLYIVWMYSYIYVLFQVFWKKFNVKVHLPIKSSSGSDTNSSILNYYEKPFVKQIYYKASIFIFFILYLILRLSNELFSFLVLIFVDKRERICSSLVTQLCAKLGISKNANSTSQIILLTSFVIHIICDICMIRYTWVYTRI